MMTLAHVTVTAEACHPVKDELAREIPTGTTKLSILSTGSASPLEKLLQAIGVSVSDKPYRAGRVHGDPGPSSSPASGSSSAASTGQLPLKLVDSSGKVGD